LKSLQQFLNLGGVFAQICKLTIFSIKLAAARLMFVKAVSRRRKTISEDLPVLFFF
jgi:hypothetical protein